MKRTTGRRRALRRNIHRDKFSALQLHKQKESSTDMQHGGVAVHTAATRGAHAMDLSAGATPPVRSKDGGKNVSVTDAFLLQSAPWLKESVSLHQPLDLTPQGFPGLFRV